MRNLTIRRNKSFVASLGKMKVYIEDADAGEILIDGVPCRKLGDLKNGEEQTFLITEQAARVYVIADKLSRNYSNDYYPIPAGWDPVFLSGKNCYNPGAGNPFRFDGVTDPTVLANRKKGSKKGIVILIVALILGFVLGIAGNLLEDAGSRDPKRFSGDGMSITLTESFTEASFDGYTICFDSRDAAVFALKEEFTLMPGLEDYTIAQYGALVLDSNGMSGSQLYSQNGVTYFTYTATADGTTFYYMATLHKSSDAFWLVQFAAPESEKDTFHPLFIQWATTISFD